MNPSRIACSIAALVSAAAAQAQTSKPNVIVIMTDDVGYGDFSCYGATRVHTPHIDQLAARGTRFTDAHASASTSTPSRYAFLTGEYPFRRPGTDVAAGNAGMIIKPEQFTLADLFKRAGYATAAIGKWHLGLGSKTGTDVSTKLLLIWALITVASWQQQPIASHVYSLKTTKSKIMTHPRP